MTFRNTRKELTHHWAQGLFYIPYRADTAPILPHRAGASFTPWCNEAVAYGNTVQCFHPSDEENFFLPSKLNDKVFYVSFSLNFLIEANILLDLYQCNI